MINFEATPPPAAWDGIAERLDDDLQYTALATKMYNFTAVPPDSLWNAIESRLNDDTQYAVLASRLNNFESTPPDFTWQSIAARLDDDNQHAAIATRLNAFEATPPLSSWEEINARLDIENTQVDLATKMQNFDAAPPAQVWNKIVEELEETEQKTPVINFRSTLYRVAAAAILAGLIVGSWLLIENKKTTDNLAKNNTNTVPAAKEESKDHTNNDAVTQKKEPVTVFNKPDEIDTKKQHYLSDAVTDNNDEHILKPSIVNDLLAYQENPIIITSSPILDNEGNIIRNLDVLTTSNYIMVTGPNGQSTRISSKFANVIRYLNGEGDNSSEEYLDKVIKESDTWKKRFQEWRNKISQSSFIPSSSNFLDIIEFKELIQEKQ